MVEIISQQEIQAKISQMVERAKGMSRNAYFVGVGALSRAEETAQTLFEEYANVGAKSLGEDAEEKPKALLAGYGFLSTLKTLQAQFPGQPQAMYERWVEIGQEKAQNAANMNELLLAAVGAGYLAKEESEKLINELLAAGEKRSA